MSAIPAAVRGFLKCSFKLNVEGTENVPQTGGLILAPNHRSYWDVVFLGATFPRELRYMAKAELFRYPVFGSLLKALGAFPIQRGKGDIGAVKAALKILKEGNALLIFPEGKRCEDDTMEHAKPGVAMFANMAGVPVVPAYISGEYKFRRKVTVKYGKPIMFDSAKKLRGEELQNAADTVLSEIRKNKVE